MRDHVVFHSIDEFTGGDDAVLEPPLSFGFGTECILHGPGIRRLSRRGLRRARV